ncbi:MAG: AAA family ATPase [Actinomycetales bacterium]|nr:AAA family ATPase [Actinomycetales bacterium]
MAETVADDAGAAHGRLDVHVDLPAAGVSAQVDQTGEGGPSLASPASANLGLVTDTWEARFRAAFGGQRPELLDGDASRFAFAIQEVHLKGGSSFNVEPGGVTAIVGANNAGKSTILREINEMLAHRPGHPELERLSLDTLKLLRDGNPGDVVAWVGDHSSFVTNPGQAGFQRLNTGVEQPLVLTQAWTRSAPELGALAPFVCFYGNAQGRFSVGGSAEMRDASDSPATHPVHYLQDDRTLLDEVSTITQKIFREPLTLDPLGRTIRLRVGKVDLPVPPIDNIPADYRQALAALRPLDEQGDGMRSLLGQLLPLVSATFPVVLLDEPEAFLHPPQAYALGVELGRLAHERRMQVILATHDRNLLSGLLSTAASTSVVRLTREAGPAEAHQLNADDLQLLWTDPVLKYTNVLDGLFHRLVVLAEAESDCGYLAAALGCPDRPPETTIATNEVLFVPTGGKDGMAKVATALKAVRVPVVAAPDLDVIADEAKLSSLVDAVGGGGWTPDLSDLWRAATADLTAPRQAARVDDVLEAVEAVLDPHRGEDYSVEHREKVKAQLRASASPWEAVKAHGMSAFRKQARVSAEALVKELQKRRVVVVQDGELECLAPTIAVRKGPGWLQAALAANEQCNPATQAHIDRILAAGAHLPPGASNS